MTRQERVSSAIKDVVSTMMDRVMVRVMEEDPFVKEEHHASKPLYAALVPDEIFKGSHFERRFVTPFGKVWEKLANVVAVEAHGKCLMGHAIEGNIATERLRRIQETLNRLEHSAKDIAKQKPDWEKEITYILEGKGEPIPVTVVCDIYVENEQTGEKYAFELKGPLPNSDQTKVSKEKIFKLLAMQPQQVTGAFYALPYKWGFPMRWFNMQKDNSVLIGDEFWDLIGGEGTYQNFIKEINKLGKNYRERIYREFLEIEPPANIQDNLLK
jgi:hypothetical protein